LKPPPGSFFSIQEAFQTWPCAFAKPCGKKQKNVQEPTGAKKSIQSILENIENRAVTPQKNDYSINQTKYV